MTSSTFCKNLTENFEFKFTAVGFYANTHDKNHHEVDFDLLKHLSSNNKQIQS